jgi:HlyD family secretion protein
MKKAVKYLIILAIVGIAIWYLFLRGNSADAMKADDGKPKTAAAKRGNIRVTIETTGQVAANREIEIKCKASGEVINLPVDKSDPVKKGALLIELDPVNETRNVERAKVSLAVSQARFAQAQLNVAAAEETLNTSRTRAEAALASAVSASQDAQARFERTEQLLAKNMTSKEEYGGAKAAADQAAANVVSANANLLDIKTQELALQTKKQEIIIAAQNVKSDNLSLLDAEQRLADTTVLSPINAVVAECNVQEGQIIASGINNIGGGTTIMTLEDLDNIFVYASVDESDIGRIEPNQNASITVDAYPNMRFPGVVKRVAIKGITASNVVTFEVKIEVMGKNKHLLRPQMTANITITAADKDNALLVPAGALSRKKGGEWFVTVVKSDGTNEERKVVMGLTNGEMTEVLEGLKEGETVLIQKAGAQSQWQGGGGRERRGPMGPPHF